MEFFTYFHWPLLYGTAPNNNNKYTSYLDWHRSPHLDRRHCQRWPVCHTGLVTARPVRRTWLTTIQCIDFSIFGLGANPWTKVHRKGRRPGGLLDLPSCKISSLYVNPCPRYLLPKFCEQRNKKNQTVTDISPTCLSACGDNNHKIGNVNYHRSNRQIHRLIQSTFVDIARTLTACASANVTNTHHFVHSGGSDKTTKLGVTSSER